MTFGQLEAVPSVNISPLINLVPDSFLEGQEVISSIAGKHLHCHWLGQKKKALISKGKKIKKAIYKFKSEKL